MRNKLNIVIAFLMVAFAAQAQIDRSKMPEPGPTPTINLGEPETFTLSNGLTVLLVENHKLPRVSISLMIDNAPHAEGNKAGISSLTASLLGNGTTTISKDDYNEEVDFLGAFISLNAEGAYARTLSKYFERVTELMADGAINPNFTQEELDTEKQKLIENLKQGEKNAAAVAGRVRNVLLYGENHPYGEYTTEETINNVTLADIKSYYKTYFVPEHAYMVVSGDFKASKAKKYIKKYFGPWLKATAPNVSVPDAKNIQYTQIDFVDMPNAVQSEVGFVSPVKLKMGDPDYPAVLVANYILGGSFGSYLNMNLREQHGYTYGARSSVSDDKYSNGAFRAAAKVRNAVTDSAVVEMLKEIKRIRTEEVEDKDLENAKAKYLGDFIMDTEDPQTTARYAINIKAENLPEDYYKTFISRINAVTKEDVMRVANKYFPLHNSRIVVVGKGSDVLHNLEKIEFDGKPVPVFYFDKFGKKIDRPVFSKPIPEGVTAKTVLNGYIEALGGADAVGKLKTLALSGDAEIQGMKLHLELKKTTKKQLYMDISLNGNSMNKQVYNGKTAFVIIQGQRKDITDEETLKALEDQSTPIEELDLLKDDSVKLTAIESVNGKDVFVIAVDENTNNYYDTETNLKIMTVTTQEVNGQTASQTSTFEDYKEVKGVKIPHVLKQTMGPQELAFILTSVKVNEGVSDADFK